ncbi:hypothetical protein [Paracoccus sp. (in: a-proteobacteria)]|uniref:hypothetical protein n=1 Tax=Paracoccus sp. TaxID=267 RepID=UPI003A89A09A
MPLLIAVLTIAALVVWRLWARDRAQAQLQTRLDPFYHRLFNRRKCRWTALGGRHGLQEFRCGHCGVTAYSREANGPRECKKQLRNRL